MDLGIQNQTALVTASTAGIGLAVATALAREGAQVVVNSRTQQRVDDAIAGIVSAVPDARVRGVAADVATAEGAQALIAAVPEADILVNNAGLFIPKAFEDLTDQDWAFFFEINVMTGVRLARHYLPGMIARNRGRIVFVSSEAALEIPVEAIPYGATKAAVLALARGLAEKTRGTGVTVNSVLPGPTSSEAFGGAMAGIAAGRGIPVEQLEKEFFAQVRPSSLISRFATTGEVANMIVYLSSAAASATNGAAIRVEGGILKSIV